MKPPPLPNAPEAEAAILSMALMDGAGILQQAHEFGISPASFWKAEYRALFVGMMDLFAASQEINPTSLVTRLRETKTLDDAGGFAMIAEVLGVQSTTLNAPLFLQQLRDCTVARNAIAHADAVKQAAYEYKGAHAGGIIEALGPQIDKLNTDLSMPAKTRSWKQIAEDAKAESVIRRTPSKDRKLLEITFPWPRLNELFSPIEAGELVTIAARPSVGKSSFACLLAWWQVQQKKPVLFHSLEVSDTEFATNLAAKISGIQSRRVENLHDGDFNELQKSYDLMAKAGDLFNINTADDTLAAMVARAKAAITRHKIRVWFIDYLQLIRDCSSPNKNENTSQSVGRVTAGLKRFAANNGIAVVVLSQLNRELEKRTGHPRLSDLRDSGSIEQDSSRVIFLHRPPSYNLNGVEMEQDLTADITDQPCHYIEIIQAKGRNVGTGASALHFHRQTATFRSIT